MGVSSSGVSARRCVRDGATFQKRTATGRRTSGSIILLVSYQRARDGHL